MTRDTVVLTGAHGFIGSHLVRSLRERGIATAALSRAQVLGTAPPFTAPNDRPLAELLERAVALVHLAGRVHLISDRSLKSGADFQRDNVDVTRMLAEAAAAAGVPAFVYASSVKAIAERADQPLTETSIPAPLDAYGRSKLEGEHAVFEIAARRGMRAVALRFPLVYGPGMRANMLRLFQLVHRGVPLPLGAVQNRRTLLYVSNAVAALECAVSSPQVAGPFLLGDDESVSTPNLVRMIADALGVRARLIPVPVVVLRSAAAVGDFAASILPIPAAGDLVGRLVDSLVLDTSRFKAVTGFHNPFSLAKGIAETAHWYRTRELA